MVEMSGFFRQAREGLAKLPSGFAEQKLGWMCCHGCVAMVEMSGFFRQAREGLAKLPSGFA